MADISKININGISYNIKQPAIPGSLPANGGTSDYAHKVNLKQCSITGGNPSPLQGEWNRIKVNDSNYIGTANFYSVYDDHGPTTYGDVIELVDCFNNHWQPQLYFGAGETGSLYHRNKGYNDDNWGNWYALLDTCNYTDFTVPKSGGTFTGNVTAPKFITTSGIELY